MTRKEVVKDLKKVLRNLQDESLFTDNDFNAVLTDDGQFIDTSRVYQYLIAHVKKY